MFCSLCALKRIKTACVPREHSNEVWLMGLPCLRSIWGPWKALSHKCGSWSVTVCASCTHLHDVAQRRWVRGPQYSPALVHFLSLPFFISPCLALSKPSLPPSAAVVENRWNERRRFLESDLFGSTSCYFFLLFPWIARAKAKAGRSPPENQPLCSLSPNENTPLFSSYRGMEGREGRQNLQGN